MSPYYSGSFRNLDLIRFLVPLCDLSAKDQNGRTALSYAEAHNDDQIMTLLLSKLGSNSKAKRLSREASQTLVSLPSTVVHSSDPWQVVYDFQQDYLAYMDQVKAERKHETENLSHAEAVAMGLKPKADSRVEGSLEVVDDDELERPFNVMLVKVDLPKTMYSTNVYYKMQLLFDSQKNLFILFTNWGRVGVPGQHQQTPYFKLVEAKKEFTKIFKQKSGNEWANVGSFEKKFRKYNLIKMSNKTEMREVLRPFEFDRPDFPESRLPDRLQTLMRVLTNSKMYQLAYSTFNISQQYLPFGNLQREVLLKAKDILNEIKGLLEKLEQSLSGHEINTRLQIAEEINQKSGEYYEMVPSSRYTESAIPSFRTRELKNAMRIIDDLLDFEIASKILCAAQFRQQEVHPFDYCLGSLGVRMAVVDPRSEEAQIIQKYVSASGSQPKTARNIFAVSRLQEEEHFVKLENRRMLWHGTKAQNLISILHQGLKIKPFGAEYAGSMFGNGIYFADYFGKAVNYSSNSYGRHSRSGRVYVWLCEVSLGNMKKLYKAQDVPSLEPEFNSVKGCGASSPSKEQNFYLNNGALVPLGALRSKKSASKQPQNFGFGGSSLFGAPKRPAKFELKNLDQLGKRIIGLPDQKSTEKKYVLNYNEYVIYNPNQIKLRYLVEI